MEQTDFGQTVSPTEFLERFRRPVILHFQPDQFQIAETPEQLRNWESLLQTQVGLPRGVIEAMLKTVGENGGSCCESGNTNDCDVD